MDENLQILKILSDVAETTFRTKKSSPTFGRYITVYHNRIS